jgi:hypothetical protein
MQFYLSINAVVLPACRRTHGVLWAGLILLVAQWSLFLRLTFWELSWDVMEPISYFFSSLWGILAYCYFLVCCISKIATCVTVPCMHRREPDQVLCLASCEVHE